MRCRCWAEPFQHEALQLDSSFQVAIRLRRHIFTTAVKAYERKIPGCHRHTSRVRASHESYEVLSESCNHLQRQGSSQHQCLRRSLVDCDRNRHSGPQCCQVPAFRVARCASSYCGLHSGCFLPSCSGACSCGARCEKAVRCRCHMMATHGCVSWAAIKRLSSVQLITAVLCVLLQPAILWSVLGCRWNRLPYRLRRLCCRAGGLCCRAAKHDGNASNAAIQVCKHPPASSGQSNDPKTAEWALQRSASCCGCKQGYHPSYNHALP